MIAHPRWSILICSVPTRQEQAAALHDDLMGQADGLPVEILRLTDNYAMDVGTKRNMLVAISRGDYISFVDDDDLVAEDYVAEIWPHIGRIVEGCMDCRGPLLRCGKHGEVGEPPMQTVDVICFQQDCEHIVSSQLGRAGWVMRCEYSLAYDYRQAWLHDGTGWWRGRPAHTMVWRAALARACKFPTKNFGEDVDWVGQMCALARTEVQIPRVLYTYRFDAQRSETRG